jgi:hypothetical protein
VTSDTVPRTSVLTRAGRTPRTEVDLPSALSAIHTAGLQVVPHLRGGTVVDVASPPMEPLLPYLPTVGTWILVDDPRRIGDARSATRSADTIVLDGRARSAATVRRADADLVILAVDHLDLNGQPERSAVLVDLGELARWRLTPGLLSDPTMVAGFHLDLSTATDSAAVNHALTTVVCALHQWTIAGRSGRPILLLRGLRTLAARQATGSLLRRCGGEGLSEPVLRVDVTRTVFDVAVRTVTGVLRTSTLQGRPVLETDGLPPAAAPVHVLRRRYRAGDAAEVLLRHVGHLLPARLHGGPALPGDELAARGWTTNEHPLAVRGFPSTAGTIRIGPWT